MSAHDQDRPSRERPRLAVGPASDELPTVNRVLSGIAPSGNFTLGNYLGALRHWVTFQDGHDAFYCVVDLHALTSEIAPDALRANTLDAVLNLLAVGLDPDRSTLFVQSHVPEHPQLTWLLECTTTMGELRRMTQFKDKGKGQEAVRVGLFTYPVLMAADILLYDASSVPVGDDQRQHLELAREVAARFNNRYGKTFVVPDAAIAGTGARVMDLQHPDRKMSKSVESPLGTVGLLDSDEEITRKVRRAVTDTDGEMRYDRTAKPGLANLLDLLAAATGRTPEEVAADYTRYGELKDDVATALCELLRPVRDRRAALEDDPAYVDAVLERGAARAHEVASNTYARAAAAIGLLPPPA
jgi:tryptophanyl-tRNA synthetase